MTREEAIYYLQSSGFSEEQIATIERALEQEPKTGHWIRVTDNAGYLVWECDKCGWQQRLNTNFCPDCGCRMVEPQESEVSNADSD